MASPAHFATSKRNGLSLPKLISTGHSASIPANQQQSITTIVNLALTDARIEAADDAFEMLAQHRAILGEKHHTILVVEPNTDRVTRACEFADK